MSFELLVTDPDVAAYVVALFVTVLAFAVLVVLGQASPRRCAVWALVLLVWTFGAVASLETPFRPADGVEVGQ